MPSLGKVEALVPVNVDPPNLREETCGKNRHRPATAETAEEEPPPPTDERSAAYSPTIQDARTRSVRPVLGPHVPSMPPIVVFVGPAKKPGSPEAAITTTLRTPKSATRKNAAPRKPPADKPVPAAAKPV